MREAFLLFPKMLCYPEGCSCGRHGHHSPHTGATGPAPACVKANHAAAHKAEKIWEEEMEREETLQMKRMELPGENREGKHSVLLCAGRTQDVTVHLQLLQQKVF